MSTSKLPLVPLHKLAPGDAGVFFALLIEKTRGARRDGKPFFTCQFRDVGRTVTCMVWSDGPWFESCDKEWDPGRFYKLHAQYQEHPNYGPQIELLKIRPVTKTDHEEGFNSLDYVERSRFDTGKMFQELLAIAEAEIADEPLRRLVLALLERHSEALQRLPATAKNFYPFAGGLLEHILSVTRSCLHLADKYLAAYSDSPLNRDLVVAGALLHDIGRVAEFGDDVVNLQQTVPGRLLGHVLLGRDLIRDMARELGDVDADLVQRLEHIILSHLELPAWGSQRLPVIPECLIVHHADDLDAKLEMYLRCLTRDQETGPFTARDPILGKALLKGRKV